MFCSHIAPQSHCNPSSLVSILLLLLSRTHPITVLLIVYMRMVLYMFICSPSPYHSFILKCMRRRNSLVRAIAMGRGRQKTARTKWEEFFPCAFFCVRIHARTACWWSHIIISSSHNQLGSICFCAAHDNYTRNSCKLHIPLSIIHFLCDSFVLVLSPSIYLSIYFFPWWSSLHVDCK